jgi:DNA-directed RNA polymerase subunit P
MSEIRLELSRMATTATTSDGESTVSYECMRCGTRVTVEELSRLPEIKCICGFRVFRKARPPIVKQLKAV